MKRYISFLLILLFSIGYTQADPLKREFRAAWIATVINLDWPSTNKLSTADQKEELLVMLDKLKDTGINAVIFQVRSESDAMYNSSYEPWSFWLTGKQGKAPNPYYDPLEFAIEEAHKRGMELHAWFNPFRAEREVGHYTKDTSHVIVKHPEWVFQKGTIKILNPGIPEVRDYVTDVIMDVVTRYDVDGVHFDDYFYPYPPNNMTLSDKDENTYNTYRRGFNDIGAWRRDNINLLIAQIYHRIQIEKPYVIFGISPFGIYKNGVPSGIIGMDAYNVIYCDPLAWLDSEIIDYLTPQLYWPFGGSQDYGKLLPWWAAQMNGRHLMPGQALYRIPSWSEEEFPNQIDLNRQTNNVYGNILFRAENLFDNPKGITDILKDSYFKYKALIPSYNWKDQEPPNTPQNINFGPIVENGPLGLNWQTPLIAADGDTAFMHVIYYSSDENIDVQDAKNIVEITSKKYFIPKSTTGGYFAVTALDRNKNESQISSAITISLPEAPTLAFPEDNAVNQKDTLNISWHYNEMASTYSFKIASDIDFSNLVYNKTSLEDTSILITNLEGQKKYFWKVSAANPGGISPFSQSSKFITGFPVVPNLNSPAHTTVNVPLDTTLVWHSTTTATAYQIQVSTAQSFSPSLIIKDTTIEDTSIVIDNLESFKIHYWHVLAKNEYGKSAWSDAWGFKTIEVTNIENSVNLPLAFYLKQNYPNPFNPTTTIDFSIMEDGFVSLQVFDLSGRKVVSLINEHKRKGIYSVVFDAGHLSSGIYLYQLVSGRKSVTKKLMLIK